MRGSGRRSVWSRYPDEHVLTVYGSHSDRRRFRGPPRCFEQHSRGMVRCRARGRDAALKRFEALYQGTWSLDPKIDELRVTELQPGVVQLYVPMTFMISPAGQAAQPTRFLMNQVVVKTADGWKVSSILPIPAPQP